MICKWCLSHLSITVQYRVKFSFYYSTTLQYLDQSLSLAAPNEPFLGRPFNLFASCVEVEWRLKRRIAFRVVFPQRATARLILDLHSPYSYSARVSHRSVAPCVPTSAHFSATMFFHRRLTVTESTIVPIVYDNSFIVFFSPAGDLSAYSTSEHSCY
jgi:hypothetical protein